MTSMPEVWHVGKSVATAWHRHDTTFLAVTLELVSGPGVSDMNSHRLRQTGSMFRRKVEIPINDDQESTPSSDGMSSLIARVLDQLSVTAWLPATFLVTSVAVLLQFRSQGSANLSQAIENLTVNPFSVLVMALPFLVISTMITQAFSFQAIRILEGYNTSRWPTSYLLEVLTGRHLAKNTVLKEDLRVAEEFAFDNAIKEMWRTPNLSHSVIQFVEARRKGSETPRLSRRLRLELDATDWQSYASPYDLAKLDRLSARIDEYPRPSRFMPTLLGNVLRSVEDELQLINSDLEGFAIQRRNRASLNLRMHHDQFRNRLDMYCTLVFVGTGIAALVPLILVQSAVSWWQIFLITTGYLLFSIVSYRAAVDSAKAYGKILLELNRL